MRCFIIRASHDIHIYYCNDQGKGDERERTCGTCGSDKNIMKNYGRKTEGNRATGGGVTRD